MNTWLINLAYVSIFILGLNCLLYWTSFKIHSKSVRWFTYFISISFGIQITAEWQAHNSETNLPLLHLYTLLEFIILSIFYKKILKNEINFQKWVTFIILIIGLLIIANTYFLQPLTTFNSNAKTLTQIIFITYAIIYYFSILNKRTTPNPIINLLNAAILLYYAGSFFIFMFSNVLLTNLEEDTQLLFWIFNSLLYLVFLLMVFIAGWQIFRKHKK